MPAPCLSLSDPLSEAEGSLDPLGLASIADQLADQVLPGMTARMWRPRFLTALAVASAAIEKFRDRYAEDDGTPAYVIFEWYALEAFARVGRQNNSDLRHTPGIDKARTAYNEGVPLSPKRYLKTPTVFGFHGVYKTLARDLEIVDDDLCLLENGYRLVRTWERAEGLPGFTNGQDGAGRSFREHLQRLVDQSLKAGYAAENRRWRFFPEHLHPDRTRKSERQLLWSLLTSQASSRREILRLLSKPAVMSKQCDLTEAAFLAWLEDRVSSELRLRLKAVAAYERLCRTLLDGFNWIRHLSTRTRLRPITARDFGAKAAPLVSRVGDDTHRAELALGRIALDAVLSDLLDDFGCVRDSETFFECLLQRHERIQRSKPPGNKRPWFERATQGVVVRVPYRLHEPPVDDGDYVHGYRTPSAAWFTTDLRGGQ